MAILNYTTQIAVEKTSAEIQKMLARAGAQAVLCEFDLDGVMTAMSFRLNTVHGVVSFRLPANIDGVEAAMRRDSSVPKRLKTREQAGRVAWRVVKDWIEAQLAIVTAEMANLVEVFLPYAQNEKGETVYQAFEKNGFLQLTHDS